MPNTLIFPDGVRLAKREEIPGPESQRAAEWARIESANITSGFVLTQVVGERFAFYAEANVDAPSLWPVFRDLSRALIEEEATLLFSEVDDQPNSLGSGDISTIIDVLSWSEYQLAHDGFLQFGVVSDNQAINEVLVAPTKHLQIWLNDEMRFRAVMQEHGVLEVSQLEFLDQYPTTTTVIPSDRGMLLDVPALGMRLQAGIAANKGRPN